MKRIAAPAILALLAACVGGPGHTGVDRPSEVPAADGVSGNSLLANLPLYFVENRGQAPGRIDYYLQGGGMSVGLSEEEMIVSLSGPADASGSAPLRVRFVGSEGVRPVGMARTPTVVSYFKGSPEEWKTGLPTYFRIAYEDLWPGIDLVYSGRGGRLKYSFLVEPGADPSDIRLGYRGATSLQVTDGGRLEASAPSGTVIDGVPYAYQEVHGRRVEIHAGHMVRGSRAGFRLGSHDPSLPLVIDPVLTYYAGYIGGAENDRGHGIAVGPDGSAYVVGQTLSPEASFPETVGPDLSYNTGEDAFVARVNPAGTALVYAGYIGGDDDDFGYGIAVDGAGSAYVTGRTDSTQLENFPVVGGPDTTHNGGFDAFVTKINPSGTAVTYSGYIGGSGFEEAADVDVDAAGNAYVAGFTDSTEATFPDTVGPDPMYNGGGDAFVAKVAASGANLVYAGYIGGNLNDGAQGVAVDAGGAAYVAGDTESLAATFPETVGPDLVHNGGFDAFVAKVAPTGISLSYAGYIGGGANEFGRAIAVDGSGAAFVTGETASTQATFPEIGGPDLTSNGGLDAYVAKVSPTGSSLQYAGFVGGAGDEIGLGVAVDQAGSAVLMGATQSSESSFPVRDGPDLTQNGLTDDYVAKVAATGASLVYAGYIGGADQESFGAGGIDVDGNGTAYVTGDTTSTEATFPDGDGFGAVAGPDITFNGNMDAFVAKVGEPLPPSASCKGKTATVVGTPGKDTLNGTNGADVIAALGGNDRVKALGGKDLVCAGSGRDTANGGSGADKVNGEAGQDKLKGAGGNDKLNGGPGKDTCIGGPGKDRAPKCEKKKSVP